MVTVQLEILEENVKEGSVISLYRVGPMVDLCRGPHLPTTTAMKALAVTNASRAFWRGDTSKDGLQRVYGIAFTDKKVPLPHVILSTSRGAHSLRCSGAVCGTRDP